MDQRENPMTIRLAIVDGHTLLRYGLRELASRHHDVEIVAECGSAAEAAPLVVAARPDVITLDIALPGGDGLTAARRLRDRHPGLGIVILSSQDEDQALFRAAESGASAFVAKTAPVAEVLAAIRQAAVAPASFGASGLAAAIGRRQRAAARMRLSPRETEVLGLLSDGMSVPAIAAHLRVSLSTAKSYVARLYEKLGATNRAQALMTAMRHGLINAGAAISVRHPLVPPARAAGQPGREPAALAS
jgi:DNA-binding NarL/FixJ family response regulator